MVQRKQVLCFFMVLFIFILQLPSFAAASTITIQDTVIATLEYHRGLKAIQENREVIIHELRRAKAGWGPSVDLTARAGSNYLNDSTTRALKTDKGMYGNSSLGMLLVQPLWDGFATRSRVRTAEATLQSMDHRIMDNATTLALDGIIAHIDIIRRREIVRLAQANVERHKEILVSSRDRQLLGADTVADTTQTEGRLARAQATLSEAKAALREGEATYQRLTGRPVPSSLAPVPLPAPMYTDPEEVFQIAKKTNPKIQAYLADVKASVGNKELAQSAFHPKINLEMGPSYADRSGANNQWSKSFDVMGTMRWNIFNSGADVAETKAATARVRQTRQELYDFVDTLTLEVEDTWTGLKAAREQNEFYVEAIQFNSQTRDSYLEQFMLGQRSLLDVLDAENELFNSSTQAATAQGNILVGSYKLYALSGTLLQKLQINTEGLYSNPKD